MPFISMTTYVLYTDALPVVVCMDIYNRIRYRYPWISISDAVIYIIIYIATVRVLSAKYRTTKWLRRDVAFTGLGSLLWQFFNQVNLYLWF